jgi:hypothetical protein
MNNKVVAMETINYKPYNYDKSLEAMSLKALQRFVEIEEPFAQVLPYLLITAGLISPLLTKDSDNSTIKLTSAIIATLNVFIMLLTLCRISELHNFIHNKHIKITNNIDKISENRKTNIEFRKELERLLKLPETQEQKETIKKIFLNRLQQSLNFNDTLQVLSIASLIIRNDKQIILLALNKAVNSWETLKIMKLAGENARNSKEVVLAAVTKNGLAFKFSSESLKKDNDIIQATLTSINRFINNTCLTKFISTTTEAHENTQGTGHMSSSNESGDPHVTNSYKETTTTYGFDEEKADELLKGLPQNIIDEVKKQLANKTRTETRTA